MVFRWSLSDGKSPRISRIVLGILADLNNSIVCIVPARPLISSSSRSLTHPLRIVPCIQITIGISTTFMFHGYYYYYYYYTPLEFFASVSADGFSREFDWQQVSSSLQDSSQDSGRS